MQYTEIILLWAVFSVLVLLLWSLMMGDPRGSKTSDIIITVICFILGLPLFLPITLGVLLGDFIAHRLIKKTK